MHKPAEAEWRRREAGRPVEDIHGFREFVILILLVAD